MTVPLAFYPDSNQWLTVPVSETPASDQEPPWTPLELGAALKAWWSADDTVDGPVPSWIDRIGGLPATGVAGQQPVSAATSFNGVRGVTFDGVDDCLTRNGPWPNFPIGSTPGEIWATASCTASGVTGVGMFIAMYGSTGATARGLQRRAVSGVNRPGLSDGATSLTGTVGDVSGPHIYRGVWSGTTQAGWLDGSPFTPPSATIATLNTSTTRLRIGAANGAAAAQFWTGPIRNILITTGLTSDQQLQLEGWLAWDGNLESVLPSGHPSKLAPPTGPVRALLGYHPEHSRWEAIAPAYLSVWDYGATGDGFTDDTAAVRAAIAEGMRTRSTVYFPKGTYSISSPVTGSIPNSHIKLRGEGEDSIIYSHVESDAIINSLGTLPAASTLSSPAVLGDRTLTVVTTAGYLPDQDVEIRDESQQITDWDTGTPGITNKGEMNRIRTITDATHLLLWSRIEDNYNTGTKVNPMGMASTDFDIRDLAFHHTPLAAINAAQRGIVISRARRVYMENLVFRGYDSACIHLAFVVDGMFTNIRGEDLTSSDPVTNNNPYLIIASEGCNGIICDRLYLRQGRHCFTTGADLVYIEPAHITVSDSMAYECMAAGFDTHPGSRKITFDNCEVWGSDYSLLGGIEGHGFQLRGRQSTVQNCRASSVLYGVTLSNSEDCIVTGSEFNACTYGVHTNNSPNTLIRDVVCRNSKTSHIWIEHQSAPTIDNITVQNVRLHGNPSGPAIDYGSYWRDSYRIENAWIPDATVKFSANVPSSHSFGIIDKSASFSVTPNLSCVYRTTGTVTATLPPLAGEMGNATYTFTEVSGALTIDGNGAETIDGVASITPTGTVRVKKNGETGAWVSW